MPFDEFYIDSDNSPLPNDRFDDAPSPTNSFNHAPIESSSRNSVVDSGSSSEGKQSTAATRITSAGTPEDKGNHVKQEWSPSGGFVNYFDDHGLKPGARYTAASSPSHCDTSFNHAFDMSPRTGGMGDLDLSVQTTNMQSLEIHSPIFPSHMPMQQSLAPDTMLRTTPDAFQFGSPDLYPSTFNFDPSRNPSALDPNPFSPGSQPRPASLGLSPVTQTFHGLPSGSFPAPYPTLQFGDFGGAQMGLNARIQRPNPAQGPSQTQYNGMPPYGPPPYTLEIWDAADKSRVETQIPLVLVMSHLPHGIKRLHLPTHAMAKSKLLQKPTPEPAPDMLELHTSVVCTSAVQKHSQMEAAKERARKASEKVRSMPVLPSSDSSEEVLKPQDGGEVYICDNCIERERKRSARKKIKRQDDEALFQKDGKYRIIVFNLPEVQEWVPPKSPVDESGQPQSVDGRGKHWWIKTPMRIACYCRHHAEKMGFHVIFTLTDYKGNFVAQAVSRPIMITDDHKTPQNTAAANTTQDANFLQMGNGIGGPSLGNGQEFHAPPQSLNYVPNVQRNMSITGASARHKTQLSQQAPSTRNLSRSVSPVAYPVDRAKMRKTSDTSKMAVGANMASLDATMFAGHHQPNSSMSMGTSSPGAAVFPPTPPQCTEVPAFGSAARQADRARGPLLSNPPTPSHFQRPSFSNVNGTAAGLDHANNGLYSGLTSVHQSRAPSPATVINTNTVNMRGINPALSIRTHHDMALSPALANSGAVAIHKVIPGEGSVMGSMDVTILGENFRPGMEVVFGNKSAVTTTFWGEKTLVCLVPPADAPGRVPVTIKNHELTMPGNTQFFTYTNDTDVQILKQALFLLNNRLTNNKFGDVVGWANQINTHFGQQQPNSSSSGHNTSGGGGPGMVYKRAHDGDLESELLGLLDMVEFNGKPRSARVFDLRRKTGQTLMHLASYLGFRRFVNALLARGANPDARDRGGYTPLHIAALRGQLNIVSLLLAEGADPTMRTLAGVTATDIASSETVRRAISRFGLHTRSKSGVSLHSRNNSARDLKIQPLTEAATVVVDSGEESPEYSTFASSEEVDSSEEEQEQAPLFMSENKPARRHRRATDIVGGLGSPATAMTALKDHMAAQFQQLPQSMQMLLANLPQFPQLPPLPQIAQLPQLPQFPQLPQLAYLAQMPNMPNLPPSLKERDWWIFLSSLAYSNAAQNPQAPPPYDEVCPPNTSLDKKQASAVQAVLEADADAKCAALYDQTQRSSSEVDTKADIVTKTEESKTVKSAAEEPPALLQIGRKNAITQEQQENFLRARAAKLKEMSWDKNLFLIWIPILIAMGALWLYTHSPRFVGVVSELISPVRGFVLGEVQ
ncbi:hypothetical protein QBC38DRAFT_510370 [Podospora fimiseda]|uniref:IPT/TIG domain-containing protein n=1 Tax=Podospora fimiseda TaxID=252190 RepID=A0AAN7H175_9PEZI|nr:hypothetical protein QBC38DRAFT_510370 [Podospora fimiseda]